MIGALSRQETEEAGEREPGERRPRTRPARAIPASEVKDPFEAEGALAQDNIGIVTIQDGPSLSSGEIIAPAVGNDRNDPNYHNNYQDPEAFLRSGGRRVTG